MGDVSEREVSSGEQVRHDDLARQASAARDRYLALLRQMAEIAASPGPGYDGRPPEIVDAPHPDKRHGEKVKRNIREAPLDTMYHRRQIVFHQWSAGDMLRADMEAAQISPHRTVRLDSIYVYSIGSRRQAVVPDPEPGAGRMFQLPIARQRGAWNDLKPVQLDAMDRVNRARAALEAAVGTSGAEAVQLFVGDRMGVAEIAGLKRYGARNKVGDTVRAGLDELAKHYGIMTTGPERGRMSTWGDDAHRAAFPGAGKKRRRA